MYSKEDFMKHLYSVLPNDLSDPEAVDKVIDLLYDVFDTMSYVLVPADLDALEYAIASIICFNIPFHNADGIANQIKEHLKDWEVEDEVSAH